MLLIQVLDNHDEDVQKKEWPVLSHPDTLQSQDLFILLLY